MKEDATFFDGDDVVAFMSRDSYKGVSVSEVEHH